MKLYIIAGEASGDLHGSNLIKELKKQHADLEIRAWGGDLMKAAEAGVVKHYRDLAFMGFVEVAINLKTILANLELCKKDIKEFNPDAVILIDYPGFNLRIAKYAKLLGTKVFYYISPQLWAWKESRVEIVKKFVDRMFVILPFEQEFYKKHQYEVDFVGHPLLDAIPTFSGNKRNENDKKLIALLPGSRKQEIKKMLPIMLAATSDLKGNEFVIAAAPSIQKEFYLGFLKNYPDVKLVFGETYSLLSKASAAMVTSGTATLETALFEVPEVVCYKGGYLSYRIAKALVKIKYISLVNLIMDREVVKELIQQEFTKENLVSEMKKILAKENSDKIKNEFILLKHKLGGAGASGKTAELMLKYLNKG